MKLTRTLVGASVAAALSLTGLGHAAFADPPSTPDPSAQSATTAAGRPSLHKEQASRLLRAAFGD